MIIRTLKVLIVLLFCLPCAVAFEGEPEDVLVTSDNEIWLYLLDEPSGYMQDAREAFLLGDTKNAALGIRKASAFIKLKSHRAEKEAAETLKVSAIELLDLAASLEKGSVKTTGAMLGEAFARAEYALADHYLQLAQKYEASEKYEEAAVAIEASVSHLLFASFWAEESLPEPDILSLKEARSDISKMPADSGYKKKKIKKAQNSIGRGIKELGKRIRPYEPQDDESLLK